MSPNEYDAFVYPLPVSVLPSKPTSSINDGKYWLKMRLHRGLNQGFEVILLRQFFNFGVPVLLNLRVQ